MRTKVLAPLLLLAALAFAATGSFTGQVINGPNLDAGKKWVFIQAARGATRKVEISSARVRFAIDVPRKNRLTTPEDAVREGAQVRVTASQDGDGEWKASSIEIVKPAEQ